MTDIESIGVVRYEWSAPEFAMTRRTPGWYGVAGLVALLAIGYTIYTSQWVGLAVVMMIGVIMYLVGRVSPRQFVHQLTDRGVKIGDKFYAYGQLRAFWVTIVPEGRALNLLPAKKLSLLLTLQLGDADVEKVREILLEFLPEEAGRGEDLVDRVGRWFRF